MQGAGGLDGRSARAISFPAVNRNADPRGHQGTVRMDDRLRLTELVCARLCHDLSGLLGSLVGTLELVTEASEDTEAAQVATTTATELALRLTLLRAAWGGQAEPLDLPRLTVLARGLAGRRLVLDLSGLPDTTIFPPTMARVILNLLLLAADSLPQGGVLRLDGGPTDLIARLVGHGAAWPAGLMGMLADSDTAWQALVEPRTLLAPLTVLFAHDHGVNLAVLLPSGSPTTPPPLRLTVD
jgi:histidine phosphotransferase ChpT